MRFSVHFLAEMQKENQNMPITQILTSTRKYIVYFHCLLLIFKLLSPFNILAFKSFKSFVWLSLGLPFTCLSKNSFCLYFIFLILQTSKGGHSFFYYSLFSGPSSPVKFEKLKCIINYFKRVSEHSMPITFLY